MKSASTQARTEAILYDIVNGSRSKPLAQLDYYDTATSTWKTLEDIKNISFTQTNENRLYGNFSPLPPATRMSANVDNRAEKYSPGSGGEFDGAFVRNRLIRVLTGYQLNDTTSVTYEHDPDSSTGRVMYHTQVITDKIYNDKTSESSFTNLPGITDSWVFYGDATYDDNNYQPEGYYQSSIIDFFVYDTETLQQLNIDADTTGIRVYYRASNDKSELENNTLSYTELGTTINGTKSFTLTGVTTNRWFQFALVFETGVWGTGYAENIEIVYLSAAEYFTQGKYLMDNPGFSARFGDYQASFTARDYFKKALETKISCPSYSAGSIDLATILQDAANRAGIPHNDGSETIPATGYTVKIADEDNWRNVETIDIMSEVLQYLLSKDSSYRLKVVDENLKLFQIVETPTTAEWQLHYEFNMQNIDKRYESTKLLQRVTVLTTDHITEPEIELASQLYSTAQTNQTLSWSEDAMYTRIVVTGTGIFTLDEVDLINKQIQFDIIEETSGGGVSATVTVYGGELKEGFNSGTSTKTVLYSTTTPVKIISLPPNSVITDISVQVSEAFNSAGTDYIQVGSAADPDKYAADIDVSSIGDATVTRTAASFGILDVTDQTDIYAVYQPGTSGQSAGSAIVRVEYYRLARYKGESINYTNQENYDGFTQKIINRCCQSDAECKTMAENLISLYGNPDFKVRCTIPANPLLEVGDDLLIWEKYTNTRKIYRLDEISTTFGASGAILSQDLVLTDTGQEFDMNNFVWSANGGAPGANDMSYSTGMLWSQDLGIVASDSNTYDDYFPITFS